ncbi:Insulinase (Peptidase M16), partial [Serendipita sp. 399]
MATESYWTPVTAQGDLPGYSLYTRPIEKPDLDERQYRLIKLENGLQALLVHDATTDKAAAAMDVGVGHLSDPDDVPGLAHFCEHLLFLGTKQFPKESDYSQFIKSNGGSTNAYTSTSNTCYFFSVGAGHLAGALDRFSGFFHSPLFDPNCTMRELNAVNSEHKKNAQSDLHRIWQLFKGQALPGHPWSKFGTGDMNTLTQAARQLKGANATDESHADGGPVGQETRRRLIEWWESHYCASIMGLSIIGRESLDDLTSMALQRFSAIPNRGLSLPVESIPWGPEQQGNILFAKTVMDVDTLEISFPIGRQDALYRSKPATYLSHFIGHEGAGSLLSYLKNKGWVTQLWSGPQSSARGFAFMKVNVKLTKSGLKEYKSVLEAMYSYLSLLRATPIPEWNFEEFKSLQEIRFRFSQKQSPDSYVVRLSEHLSRPYPRDQLLSAATKVWEQDESLIRDLMENGFAPHAGSVLLSSKDFSSIGLEGPWLHEKWYGTEYIIQRIDPAVLEKPAKRPTLLRKTEASTLWHKKDDQFWLPKGYIGVFIKSPAANCSAKNALMTRFIECLVTDALTEYSYDASLAGLDYSLTFAEDGGLSLQTSGYTDKMLTLLQHLLDKTKNHVIRQDRFDLYKEEIRQAMENAKKREPHSLSHDWMDNCLRDVAWTVFQLLDEIPHVTLQRVQEHLSASKTDALKAQDMVEAELRTRSILPSEEISRTMLLPRGKEYIHNQTLTNPKETNNAVEYYLQIPQDSETSQAKLLLLAHLLNEPTFSILRTREQLGYIVTSYSWMQVSVMGMAFRIQSEKPTLFVENRIEQFLSDYKQTLGTMEKTDFEGQRQGLVNRLLEKLDNLDQESSRFMAKILDGTYDFTHREKNARRIEQLTLEEMIEFYDAFIDPASTSRAKLSMHMHSQTKPSAKSNFSVAASKVFLEDLKEAQVPVDEAQYTALSKTEPSVDAVVGFWTKYLGTLASLSAEKRQRLLERIKEIAELHPVKSLE